MMKPIVPNKPNLFFKPHNRNNSPEWRLRRLEKTDQIVPREFMHQPRMGNFWKKPLRSKRLVPYTGPDGKSTHELMGRRPAGDLLRPKQFAQTIVHPYRQIAQRRVARPDLTLTSIPGTKSQHQSTKRIAKPPATARQKSSSARNLPVLKAKRIRGTQTARKADSSPAVKGQYKPRSTNKRLFTQPVQPYSAKTRMVALKQPVSRSPLARPVSIPHFAEDSLKLNLEQDRESVIRYLVSSTCRLFEGHTNIDVLAGQIDSLLSQAGGLVTCLQKLEFLNDSEQTFSDLEGLLEAVVGLETDEDYLSDQKSKSQSCKTPKVPKKNEKNPFQLKLGVIPPQYEALLTYLASPNCCLFSNRSAALVAKSSVIRKCLGAGGPNVINRLKMLDSEGKRFHTLDDIVQFFEDENNADVDETADPDAVAPPDEHIQFLELLSSQDFQQLFPDMAELSISRMEIESLITAGGGVSKIRDILLIAIREQQTFKDIDHLHTFLASQHNIWLNLANSIFPQLRTGKLCSGAVTLRDTDELIRMAGTSLPSLLKALTEEQFKCDNFQSLAFEVHDSLCRVPPQKPVYARALQDYKAENSVELCLLKNQILLLLHCPAGSNWWLVQISGQRGMVPHNLLQILPIEFSPSETFGIALQSYTGKNENELSFDQGAIINITSFSAFDDVWSGELAGKQGTFSAANVEVSCHSINGAEAMRTKNKAAPLHFGQANSANELEQLNQLVKGGDSQEEKQTITPTIPSDATSAADRALSKEQEAVVDSGNVLTATAFHSFETSAPDELSFRKGDVLTIHTCDEEWWKAELNGVVGYVPHNYVKLCPSASQSFPGPVPPGCLVALQDFEAEGGEELSFKRGAFLKMLPHPTKHSESHWIRALLDGNEGDIPISYVDAKGASALATDAFESDEQGKLTFSQGDMLTILSAPPGEAWWHAELNGVAGDIPQSLVKLVVVRSSADPELVTSIVSPGATFVANHPFVAEDFDELSFQAGDVITIIKAPADSDWWAGSANGKCGSFPKRYIQRAAEPVLRFASALHAFQSEHEGELNFPIGAIISVTDSKDDDWWQGSYAGQHGLFPRNFVKPVREPLCSDRYSMLSFLSHPNCNLLLTVGKIKPEDLNLCIEMAHSPQDLTTCWDELNLLEKRFRSFDELVVATRRCFEQHTFLSEEDTAVIQKYLAKEGEATFGHLQLKTAELEQLAVKFHGGYQLILALQQFVNIGRKFKNFSELAQALTLLLAKGDCMEEGTIDELSRFFNQTTGIFTPEVYANHLHFTVDQFYELVAVAGGKQQCLDLLTKINDSGSKSCESAEDLVGLFRKTTDLSDAISKTEAQYMATFLGQLQNQLIASSETESGNTNNKELVQIAFTVLKLCPNKWVLINTIKNFAAMNRKFTSFAALPPAVATSLQTFEFADPQCYQVLEEYFATNNFAWFKEGKDGFDHHGCDALLQCVDGLEKLLPILDHLKSSGRTFSNIFSLVVVVKLYLMTGTIQAQKDREAVVHLLASEETKFFSKIQEPLKFTSAFLDSLLFVVGGLPNLRRITQRLDDEGRHFAGVDGFFEAAEHVASELLLADPSNACWNV